MTLQTARCELVPLQPDDLADVAVLYANEDVRRFLGGPVPGAAVRSSALAAIQTGPEQLVWAVRTKEGTFVGTVSLGPHHDGSDTEVSYQLLPAWWGQGYASEAVRAVLEHACTVLGLSRVVAETQSANLASRRLLERLGMRLERRVERFGAEQTIYAADLL